MQCLIESRHVYNEMLETIKQQYEEKGTFPGKYDLTARFKGRGGEHVPATTVQCLADRLFSSETTRYFERLATTLLDLLLREDALQKTLAVMGQDAADTLDLNNVNADGNIDTLRWQ